MNWIKHDQHFATQAVYGGVYDDMHGAMNWVSQFQWLCLEPLRLCSVRVRYPQVLYGGVHEDMHMHGAINWVSQFQWQCTIC